MKLKEFIKKYYDTDKIDHNVILRMYQESGAMSKFKNSSIFEVYLTRRFDYDVYYSNVIQDSSVKNKETVEFTLNLGKDNYYFSEESAKLFQEKFISNGLKKHIGYRKMNSPSLWSWEGVKYLFTSRKYE